MSTIPNLASNSAHLPPTPGVQDAQGLSGLHPTDAAGASVSSLDVTGSNSSTPAVNHLTQAVQQALNHLDAQPHEVAPANAAGPGLPVTMQGFIQSLVASLHQIGVTVQLPQQALSPASTGGATAAVGAVGSRYTSPGTTGDVRKLMQQASAVLSSNAVLQQDFQTMMRAAGVHETPSLDRFLHSVSSHMGGQSSTVTAIA